MSLVANQPTLLIVIDNLRYDQWKILEPTVNTYYKTQEESLYYSILTNSDTIC